jgi:hypothetical protein
MADLVMAIMRTKQDIVDALKKKSLLWNKGVQVNGMVVEEEEEEEIPTSFVEEMMQLKLIGVIKRVLKPKE